MEAEAETCIGALHWLPKSSWRVRRLRMWTKRSRPWWVHPLTQSTWANGSSSTPAGQRRNQHRSKLVPLNVGDSCMAGADCRATGSGSRAYSYCLYWLFGNPFSFDGYLAQPRYSRVGLGPSPSMCLPSLRSGWGVGWEVGRGNGKRGGCENWDWYVKWKKIVCSLFKKIIKKKINKIYAIHFVGCTLREENKTL